MQTNIVWNGIEYHSMENCLITTTASGTAIESTVIGLYQGKIYKAEYHILTNEHWQTINTDITIRHSDSIQQINLAGDGQGNWILNGEKAYTFNGCIDVDIAITPLTNTLPINRLRLNDGDEKQIPVIYLDVLNADIRPVKQLYSRLSATIYHYENIPNDFTADIKIDKDGFVIDYPALFNRSAILRSDYPLKKAM